MPYAPGTLRVPGAVEARAERERDRKRDFDETRGSSAERGYGYRWQRAREGWLRKHPLCVMCQREGALRAATVVDHITPHRGNKALFWSRDNWQSLCVEHHGRKTATEDSGFSRGEGASNL